MSINLSRTTAGCKESGPSLQSIENLPFDLWINLKGDIQQLNSLASVEDDRDGNVGDDVEPHPIDGRSGFCMDTRSQYSPPIQADEALQIHHPAFFASQCEIQRMKPEHNSDSDPPPGLGPKLTTSVELELDYRSTGISEGSLVCVNAINETLQSPYRLDYFPPLAQKPLMFWTEFEYMIIKELVRLLPEAYPYITKLTFAENSNLEYSSEKFAALERDYRNSTESADFLTTDYSSKPSYRREETDQQFRSRQAKLTKNRNWIRAPEYLIPGRNLADPYQQTQMSSGMLQTPRNSILAPTPYRESERWPPQPGSTEKRLPPYTQHHFDPRIGSVVGSSSRIEKNPQCKRRKRVTSVQTSEPIVLQFPAANFRLRNWYLQHRSSIIPPNFSLKFSHVYYNSIYHPPSRQTVASQLILKRNVLNCEMFHESAVYPTRRYHRHLNYCLKPGGNLNRQADGGLPQKQSSKHVPSSLRYLRIY